MSHVPLSEHQVIMAYSCPLLSMAHQAITDHCVQDLSLRKSVNEHEISNFVIQIYFISQTMGPNYVVRTWREVDCLTSIKVFAIIFRLS